MEKDVRKKIRTILNDEKICWFSVPATGYSRHGVPDIHAMISGWSVYIEAKATEKSPIQVTQERFMTELRAQGGIILLVHAGNVEHLLPLIKRLHAGRGGPHDGIWTNPCVYTGKAAA